MDYNEFNKELELYLNDHFSKLQGEVKRHIVNKPNQRMEAFALVLPDSSGSPMIYPETLYPQIQKGTPFQKIAEETAAQLTEQLRCPLKFPALTAEDAKKQIRFSLVNKRKNEALLLHCPYKPVEDLAAIPRWYFTDEISFAVNHGVIKSLAMTKEEILDIAQTNTDAMDFRIQNLNDVIRSIRVDQAAENPSGHFPDAPDILYLITNQSGLDGSSTILSKRSMQSVSETLGCNEFYILPSSRHEVLAAAPDKIPAGINLNDIVISVNESAVSKEDYLSDSVYMYSTKDHSLRIL